jgi:hypothetical protein
MTDLLIRSLCELLPYKTICKDCETDFVGVLGQVDVGFGLVGIKGTNTLNAGNIPYCKPYLFPLSSMTEEQYEKFIIISGWDGDIEDIRRGKFSCVGYIGLDYIYDTIDWFNKNHFDYRGLIPMGLANDATGLNIYYKL